jgi:hypothetical protein
MVPRPHTNGVGDHFNRAVLEECNQVMLRKKMDDCLQIAGVTGLDQRRSVIRTIVRNSPQDVVSI